MIITKTELKFNYQQLFFKMGLINYVRQLHFKLLQIPFRGKHRAPMMDSIPGIGGCFV